MYKGQDKTPIQSALSADCRKRPAIVTIVPVAMTAKHALMAVLYLAAFCSKCCCLLCKLRLQSCYMPVSPFAHAQLTYACTHAIMKVVYSQDWCCV